jgi:hypothetical protein
VHPSVVERIAATPARFKLIYLVRDPLEGIESHYTHERRVGWVECISDRIAMAHGRAFPMEMRC